MTPPRPTPTMPRLIKTLTNKIRLWSRQGLEHRPRLVRGRPCQVKPPWAEGDPIKSNGDPTKAKNDTNTVYAKHVPAKAYPDPAETNPVRMNKAMIFWSDDDK